jgi:hypothetical protein
VLAASLPAMRRVEVELTSSHLTSPHLTSPHLTSPHLTSPHLTSNHLVIISSRQELDLSDNPHMVGEVGGGLGHLVV